VPTRPKADPAPDRAAHRAGEAVFALALLPILLAALAVSVRTPFWEHDALLQVCLGVASLAWLVAIALAKNGRGDLSFVVAGAIALRLIGLVGWPGLSDDVARYAWEGEVLARGASPYAFAPDAPELEALRAELPALHARVNHPQVSALYPPLAQALGAGVAGLRRMAGLCAVPFDSVLVLRPLLALADLSVLWPLAALLRRAGLPPGLAAVWGWSPLVVLEFAGSGHIDSFGILLLVGALAALAGARAAGRELGGLALLSGAMLVKVLPVCALPFVARGRRWPVRLACVTMLCGLAFVPLFWLAGGFGGLGAGAAQYGLRWESTPLVYDGFEALVALAIERTGVRADPRVIGRVSILVAWGIVGVRLWSRRADAVEAAGVMVAAFLVLTPTLHPWYVTWVLPFVALRPRFSWLWLAATAPLLYRHIGAFERSGVWTARSGLELTDLRLWIALVLFVFLVYEARRSAPGRRRRARSAR